jgi:DNA polymerase III subunit gamma/tau
MAKKKPAASKTAGGPKDSPAKPYVVLARKYRPTTFDDLIGQEAMITTLRNAFASGRIAHGYMLTGVRGVGKTTTARILARALNFETNEITQPTIDMPELGRHCAEIMESRHPDVIEMDAASNTGVDNMREIIESARYMPLVARTKVFIIDEVHMLSKGAFNALLKTLEEPPGHVKFIFATTEIRKVPVTVLSRCQRFDLRRVDVPLLTKHLTAITAEEGANADADAIGMIARAAEGSVRDALSILDQAIATSFGGDGPDQVSAAAVRDMLGLADRGRIFDLLDELVGGNTSAALSSLDGLHRDGAEPAQILCDLAEAVHLAARTKAIGAEPAGDGLSAEEKRRASALAGSLSMALLARAWQMLVKGLEETGKAPNPLAAAEMVLIRIAHTADLPPPDEIIAALGGGAVSRGRAARPAPGPAESRGPLNQSDETPTHGGRVSPSETAEVSGSADDKFQDSGDGEDPTLTIGGETDLSGAGPLSSFADVVALAGQRRDARLKVHLEEHVSLVRFDAAAGALDLHLLPGAPPEIANDLREKLNAWTGRRWVVMLSKTPGAPPLGAERRDREAVEIESLKRHPAIAAVLEVFPDAEIADVRPLAVDRDDDSAAG